MKAEDYFQDREKVYCQTSAKKEDGMKKGELVCTDHRLVYLTDGTVTDIDLRSIEEIEYERSPIKWNFLIAIGLIGFGAVALQSLASEIGFISPGLAQLALLVSGVVIVAGLAEVIRQYTETLTIKTSQSEKKYLDGDFSDFPHAIRGAAK